MNKRQRAREQILQNGFKLIRWAGLPEGTPPTTLSKMVRRVEVYAHNQAERSCSEDVGDYDNFHDKTVATVQRRLTTYLGKENAARVFVNFDPRGYALKTEDDPRNDLHRDFGGYSILAPDCDGEE